MHLSVVVVVAANCRDGMQNQDETDADCGGAICSKCVDNKMCNVASDCFSGVCQSNTCQSRLNSSIYVLSAHFDTVSLGPACNDGIQNGDETDIDCGGSSCSKCADTQACKIASDCFNGVCSSNICQGKL